MEEHPELKVLKEVKTVEQLYDVMKEMTLMVLYGDAYSSNDTHPYQVGREYRRRNFVHTKTMTVVRIEMSKALLADLENETQPIMRGKL